MGIGALHPTSTEIIFQRVFTREVASSQLPLAPLTSSPMIGKGRECLVSPRCVAGSAATLRRHHNMDSHAHYSEKESYKLWQSIALAILGSRIYSRIFFTSVFVIVCSWLTYLLVIGTCIGLH